MTQTNSPKTHYEVYLQENPVRLRMVDGFHVYKSDIAAAVNMSMKHFWDNMKTIGDANPEIGEEIAKFRTARKLPIPLAEKIIRELFLGSDFLKIEYQNA